MRQKQPRVVITFHTTTEAMTMEAYCKKHNLPGRLIPVPAQIRAGCGLAWMAPVTERALLEAELNEDRVAWEGIAEVML